MRDLRRRLERLEAQIRTSRCAWTSDVESARTRAVARLRLHIGELMGAEHHTAVQSARALLIGDTPEQAAADLKTLQRWGRAHPELLTPHDGWAARITARLEEMAQRPEAQQ